MVESLVILVSWYRYDYEITFTSIIQLLMDSHCEHELPGISPTVEFQIYKSFYYECGSYVLPPPQPHTQVSWKNSFWNINNETEDEILEWGANSPSWYKF